MASTISKIVTFRDRMRMRWVPPWLSTGNAEKFLYAISLHADFFADALVAGVASRFPGRYGYETLPVHGRERRITRGPAESDETYARRLVRWLDDHRGRGGPYALLAQLAAYYAPDNFRIDLLYKSGRHFTLAADGATITRGLRAEAFDTDRERWARWWLIFTSDSLDTSNVADLIHVPREWNAGHCIGALIVASSDARLYDWPDRTWDADVTWDSPGTAETIEVG
jgi:hypothetical protein